MTKKQKGERPGNILIRNYLLPVAMLFCTSTHAPLACAKTEYSINGSHISTSKNGRSSSCNLDITPTSSVESADGKAVIVSDRGFVLTSDLMTCRAETPIHVTQIPKGVGFLSDINVSRGIYISLDFVSTQPTAYLATVAKIGSKKNLISLDGAYINGKRVDQLQETAFTASGGAGSSTISPDGRYVAPNGQIDCSQDAYPGVWDIDKNRRVLLDSDACHRLFSTSKK